MADAAATGLDDGNDAFEAGQVGEQRRRQAAAGDGDSGAGTQPHDMVEDAGGQNGIAQTVAGDEENARGRGV